MAGGVTWYLQHTGTKRKFEIVKVDKASKTVTLKGEHSTFKEAWDPERFKSIGYELIKEGDDDAEQ